MNVKSNLIMNEYALSTNLINCKVYNHFQDGQNSNYNQAEMIAVEEEKNRIEEEYRKRLLIEERDRKIKENMKIYQNTLKQKVEFVEKEKNEKKVKKEKLIEYNNTLRSKVIKRGKSTSDSLLKANMTFKNDKLQTNKSIEFNENYDEIRYKGSVKDFETFSFNDLEHEELEKNIPEPLGKLYEYENQDRNCNSNVPVVNLREDINNYVINNIVKNHSTNNINEEINKNVSMLKNFRKKGFSMSQKKEEISHPNQNFNDSSKKENFVQNSIPNSKKGNKNTIETNKPTLTELEKRR